MLQGLNEDIAFPLLARRPHVVSRGGQYPVSIKGKKVLITGAGGSIGSELAVQVASCDPGSLTLVDISEFNLYEVSTTLAESRLPFPVLARLNDVRDRRSLSALFKETTPDIVFHAAALKHVPILEVDHNLLEGVHTNIGGTLKVANTCIEHGVADMVLVSTDKAVNPTSMMGVTKRLAEIALSSLAASGTSTRLSVVRFGNVIGSSGSVVPLFRRQIAQGGPITITHPDMTRYFMTIREAVELVMRAGDLAKARPDPYAIYVLDMGEPVSIKSLAEQLVRQSGLRPHDDIAFEYIGLRPGEKLFEELVAEGEDLQGTEVKAIQQVRHRDTGACEIHRVLSVLHRSKERDLKGMVSAMLALVPEYKGEWKEAFTCPAGVK